MLGSTSDKTTPPPSRSLMCMFPPFALLQRIVEPTSFPIHSSLLQKSFHSGELQLPSLPPSGTQKVLLTPVGKSIRLDHLL